jgi:hypothetical protein
MDHGNWVSIRFGETHTNQTRPVTRTLMQSLNARPRVHEVERETADLELYAIFALKPSTCVHGKPSQGSSSSCFFIHECSKCAAGPLWRCFPLTPAHPDIRMALAIPIEPKLADNRPCRIGIKVTVLLRSCIPITLLKLSRHQQTSTSSFFRLPYTSQLL